MEKIKLAGECYIIECNNLQFDNKVIVEIKLLRDFLWLVEDCDYFFKLKGFYYHVTNEIVYMCKLVK